LKICTYKETVEDVANNGPGFFLVSLDDAEGWNLYFPMETPRDPHFGIWPDISDAVPGHRTFFYPAADLTSKEIRWLLEWSKKDSPGQRRQIRFAERPEDIGPLIKDGALVVLYDYGNSWSFHFHPQGFNLAGVATALNITHGFDVVPGCPCYLAYLNEVAGVLAKLRLLLG
jgi:hypothetical protein